MPQIGRPPIKLDKETVTKLYASGLSSKKIGPLFQVSWATINRRLKQWSIPIKFHYLAWNKGLTVLTDERVHNNSKQTSRFLGHKHNDDTRAKMSISRKGINSWSRGSKKSEDTKKRNREATKKMWQNPEYRERQSQRMKELWANPDYANRVRPLILKGNYKKPTQPEQHLINLIYQYNLPFKYTGDGSFSIHGFHPDFVNCNGEKTVIEVFGDYWHGEGARTWKETELGRIMAFNSFGFRCIILWESYINNSTNETIVKRISNESRRV